MENTPEKSSDGCTGKSCAAENRRGFLAQAIAVVAGSVALAVPTVVGIVAFLNPLRQKSQSGKFIRLTSLDALPEDGTPRRFPVIADRTDAWNRFPNEPIGAVFLLRTGERTVKAFQTVCPHAGCSVQYAKADNGGGKFFCPCHAASFDLDGRPLDKPSPSPRRLDELTVNVPEGTTDVEVKFQDFQTGTAKKVARA